MLTVSALDYRVFAIDSPFFSTPPYPGKMVPTGVFHDAKRRGGQAYGRYLENPDDEIRYIVAKFCEEFREYREALPKKRASEMADILTLAAYARPMFKGVTLISAVASSMDHMESVWRSFQKELLRGSAEGAAVRMWTLLKRTEQAAKAEIARARLDKADIHKAQKAKADRIGSFEGWVITHLVLPKDDDFYPKLLETGWYEIMPDVQGQFPCLLEENRITRAKLKAVTSG